jgi:hypothetical protein
MTSDAKARANGASRKELAREFLESMQKAWAEKGDEILRKVVETDPATFLRAMVAVMPKELDLRVNRYEQMTDQQLEEELQRALKEAKLLGVDVPGEPDREVG